MNDRWERLRAHWAEHCVRTVPPATPADLLGFEARNRVALPVDLRDFFAELGGMDPRAVPAYDQEGFAIWPLPELRRVEADHGLFLVADYLNLSWGYAIALGPRADQPHPVLMVGLDVPRPVAASFTEFIDLYLAHSRRLYPH